VAQVARQPVLRSNKRLCALFVVLEYIENATNCCANSVVTHQLSRSHHFTTGICPMQRNLRDESGLAALLAALSRVILTKVSLSHNDCHFVLDVCEYFIVTFSVCDWQLPVVVRPRPRHGTGRDRVAPLVRCDKACSVL
jgi:hypothetical protein